MQRLFSVTSTSVKRVLYRFYPDLFIDKVQDIWFFLHKSDGMIQKVKQNPFILVKIMHFKS